MEKLKNTLNTLKNNLLKFKSVHIPMISIVFMWTAIQAYWNWDKLERYASQDVFLFLLEKVFEMILFVMMVKALLALNPFINSIEEILTNVFIKRKFLKAMGPEELLGIAKQIEAINPAIKVKDDKLDNAAIQRLEEKWYEHGNTSHIITRAVNTETLYKNGTFIIHKKLHIKMMKKDIFKSTFLFMPFDEVVAEDKEQDDYYLNTETSRHNSKTFHTYIPSETVTITPTFETKHASELRDQFGISADDERRWLVFTLSSQEIEIDKDEEFIIEISISDLVKLDKEHEKRREQYFSTALDVSKNAIIDYCFQVEIYNDKSEEARRLEFEPILYIGEKYQHPSTFRGEENKDNCSETIYYRKWNWSFKNLGDDMPNILVVGLRSTRGKNIKC